MAFPKTVLPVIFISVKNREGAAAKRPCPGRQHPRARPRAGGASQQMQAGGTLSFASA